MRIYDERGLNNVLFEFTERKFDNKYKAFFQYAKTFTKKFWKRKDKISGVYIDYIWGYKTKEPGQYYTRHPFPYDMPLTQSNILKYAFSEMEERHNVFIDESDPERQQIYYLRGVQINFVYT